MKIGIPKEIKNRENRVSLTPYGVLSFVNAGHEVYVEKNAGFGSGFSDEEYVKFGAKILETADEVWNSADMVIKVKEPLESEYKYLRKDLILFTYLHLAANKSLTEALVKSGTLAIAYETVQRDDRTLPLLAPMSEVAGKYAVQKACSLFEKSNGGRGMLLDGVTGVDSAIITVVGTGVAGSAAIKRAVGVGAKVYAIDKDINKLKEIDNIYKNQVQTIYSNDYNLMEISKISDVIISTVLIPGAKAPKLIKESYVKEMKKGSIIIDVAIDQGGSVETIDKATTHEEPTYVKYGVLHYAVANIPGDVAYTSTLALTNVTLDYALKLANFGFNNAIKSDNTLKRGVNVAYGKVTYKPVADATGLEYVSVDDFIK